MTLPIIVCLAAIGMQFSAPQAKTALVASTSVIEPGKPFSVALQIRMAPQWHSYYINPGESGQATSIKWKLPPGFKAGPILWPVPIRKVIGDVAGFIYEDNVYLITTITPPKNLRSGMSVRLGATASWLLCREACVPQKSSLELKLRTGPKGNPNPDFAKVVSAQPSRSPTLIGQAKIVDKHAEVKVAVVAPDLVGAQFFPADPTYFGADVSEIKSVSSGISLRVPLSKYSPGIPRRITGILVIPSGAAKGAHWIDIQVTEH